MSFQRSVPAACSNTNPIPMGALGPGFRPFRPALRSHDTSFAPRRPHPAPASFSGIPRPGRSLRGIQRSSLPHACSSALPRRVSNPQQAAHPGCPSQGCQLRSSGWWHPCGAPAPRGPRAAAPASAGPPAAHMGLSSDSSRHPSSSTVPQEASSAAAGTNGPVRHQPSPSPQEALNGHASSNNTSSAAVTEATAGQQAQPAATAVASALSPTSAEGPSGGSSSSTAAEAVAAAEPESTSGTATGAGASAAAPSPGATSLDGLSETRKYVLADEWGFSHVGSDLPEGTSPATFSSLLPDLLLTFDPLRAAAAIALPLAVMAAGYAWLWYWRAICPVWQQALCGLLIGTAYTGLFKVAHECARYAFLPQAAGWVQDTLGAVLMLPSLYAFPSWRLAYVHHLVHLNQLWADLTAWHPYTKVQLAMDLIAGNRLGLAVRRLVLATPLKFLASIGHWVRSYDGFDLQRFHPGSFWQILAGWAAPVMFAGWGIPAMIVAGGFSGFVSCYLFPWLVFHFWLSSLSLVLHTAPHIPFRAEGEGYDLGRATLCGTVTLRLPRPLEVLLNEANYVLPQMLEPGLPLYHAREAYEHVRQRLLPYLTEANVNVRLIINHVTKWQVYDDEADTYRPLDEVQREVEADLAAVLQEVEEQGQRQQSPVGAAEAAPA